MPGRRKIAILGAGYTGLSAAYDLAKAGHEVTVFEKESDIGGLAGAFELAPGRRIEKFYHHWFTSDVDILDFIRELGLGNKLKYLSSNTGLYYANSIYRLATPLDLLRFNGIPLIDRIRTGLMVLAARRVKDWHVLEDISAEEWIIKHAGRKSFDVIWQPLLKGKFGSEASEVSAVWFWNKLKLRGGSRNEKGSESLVYFDGGFGQVTEGMRSALEKNGVQIRTQTPVDEIICEDGKVRAIRAAGSRIDFDLVLGAIPLPSFLDMTPALPQAFREQASKIRFLGNICIVLRLKQSLSSTYWLNVADPSFPFVGIIEHTNFDDIENYGGEHIAYVSKYLLTSDSLFQMSDSEYLEYCIPYLQKIFPAFTKDWIIGSAIWRAHYSQPLITKHYSKLIPPSKTPVEGLWLSSMAQVYPEDRGTSYAVREGRRVAKDIIADLS